MIDLRTLKAHTCMVAGGVLIHQDKILLVHHKKLGIWLAPGGHLEAGELPHEAAEREVFEETNIHVKAIDPHQLIESDVNQYVPNPIYSSIHWVSQENYNARMASSDSQQLHCTQVWPNGCEQHYCQSYLMQPMGDIIAKHDPNESFGIGWFGLEDLPNLETNEDIKAEIRLAFSIIRRLHE